MIQLLTAGDFKWFTQKTNISVSIVSERERESATELVFPLFCPHTQQQVHTFTVTVATPLQCRVEKRGFSPIVYENPAEERCMLCSGC